MPPRGGEPPPRLCQDRLTKTKHHSGCTGVFFHTQERSLAVFLRPPLALASASSCSLNRAGEIVVHVQMFVLLDFNSGGSYSEARCLLLILSMCHLLYSLYTSPSVLRPDSRSIKTRPPGFKRSPPWGLLFPWLPQWVATRQQAKDFTVVLLVFV